MTRQPFRESRLYVQVVLTLGLLLVAGAVAILPLGPFGRVKQALVWTVSADYEFKEQAIRLNGWAQEHGGWISATQGVWSRGTWYIKKWVDQVGATPTVPMGAQPTLPVKGAVLLPYGWPPPGQGDQFHEGITFMAAVGAPVVAVADGTVVKLSENDTLGKWVEVDHGAVLALYGQVDAVQVKVGGSVHKGASFAKVGNPRGDSGHQTPHLYLEVRTPTSGNTVDPAIFLGLGGKKL